MMMRWRRRPHKCDVQPSRNRIIIEIMIFVIITSTSKGKNMYTEDRDMECKEEKCNIINKKTIKDSRSQQIVFWSN